MSTPTFRIGRLDRVHVPDDDAIKTQLSEPDNIDPVPYWPTELHAAHGTTPSHPRPQ